MEKIKLNIPEMSYTIIVIGETEIKVKPYIDLYDKKIILNAITESDSENIIDKILENKAALILSVVDTMTNIDVQTIDINGLICSGGWDKIKAKISNFAEIFSDYREIKESESLTSKLGEIISKAEGFMDKISSLDLSKEGIADLLKVLNLEIDKVKEFYPEIDKNASESEEKKPKKRKNTP